MERGREADERAPLTWNGMHTTLVPVRYPLPGGGWRLPVGCHLRCIGVACVSYPRPDLYLRGLYILGG